MKFFTLITITLGIAPLFAYDGDMDTYHEFKEELALVRDGYISALNMAMDDANEQAEDGWFNARDDGKFANWNDFEYNAPELEHFKVSEIPYGFQIKGHYGAYVMDAKIKVVTRDSDIFYDIEYLKGTNAPAKEVVSEIFRNDRVVFYDPKTPCVREAVTCIGEYSRGTLGLLKKKKAK